MMRSLYSGVSGLRVHQTKMDVIGNNISNVNTVGFKGSTVNFSDILYQTTQSASGPNAQTGMTGQNARQIGLGSAIASIKTNITAHGGSQRTDNPFDLMINNDSFFIVNSGGANYFTKSGAFEIDAAGTLCTSDGASVMGWQVDPTNPNKILPGQVSSLSVQGAKNATTPPEATSKAYITGNIDENDTRMKTGYPTSMQFYDSLGNLLTAKLTITADATNKGEYKVALTDIIGADDQSIFVKKNTTVTPPTYSASEFTGGDFGGAYTAAVDPATGKVTITQTAPTLKFKSGTGEFEFVGAAGQKSLSLKVTDTTGRYPQAGVDVDFSTITQYASSGSNKVTSLEAKKGDLDYNGAGKPLGKMIGLGVDSSGKIYGSYSNGDKKLLGQIAVANFSNPSGLEAVGNNRYAATQNSGDFDGIGQDITSNNGAFTSGVLEMSNVDLSQQFTDMITTQRGFQANSRIITTSDTMLEELINLKR